MLVRLVHEIPAGMVTFSRAFAAWQRPSVVRRSSSSAKSFCTGQALLNLEWHTDLESRLHDTPPPVSHCLTSTGHGVSTHLGTICLWRGGRTAPHPR